jgi:hypothetical protein
VVALVASIPVTTACVEPLASWQSEREVEGSTVDEASMGATGWERAALSDLVVATDQWRFVLRRTPA